MDYMRGDQLICVEARKNIRKNTKYACQTVEENGDLTVVDDTRKWVAYPSSCFKHHPKYTPYRGPADSGGEPKD